MPTLVNEQAAFLLDVCKLIEYAAKQGYKVTGGELFRSIEQQQIYLKTGRSKTLKSNHLKRLAIDLNFFVNGKLTYAVEDLGVYWEHLSPFNRWGGNFKSLKDNPHFERNVQ